MIEYPVGEQLLAAAVHFEDDASLSGLAIIRSDDGLVSGQPRSKNLHEANSVPYNLNVGHAGFLSNYSTLRSGPS